MSSDSQYKSFRYTLLKNANLTGITYTIDYFEATGIKQYKISIRKKLVYIVELYDYNGFVFLKFHPKIHELNPDRYQITRMGLTHSEKRKLLNTCCLIVLDEIDKQPKEDIIYAFFGQWYDKDNQQNRLSKPGVLKVRVRFKQIKVSGPPSPLPPLNLSDDDDDGGLPF